MTESIKVIIMGEERTILKGTKLIELAKDYQESFKYPIIIAKVGGEYQDLNESVLKETNIDFFDLKDRRGNLIYVNGLQYMAIYAAYLLYGNKGKLTIRHSIDKGVYIETAFKLTEEKLKDIEDKMKEIVSRDMMISKCNVSRTEAIDYFTKMEEPTKVGILKYNISNYITLYKLGDIYDYFFTYMPASTGILKYFDLTYLNDHGFVLTFPTAYIDGFKKYKHHPQIFEAFKEYHDWAKIMNIDSLSSLNAVVSSGNIGDIIRIDETLQSHRLLKIARDIYENKKNVKVILMAGPSSSGKTTTCRKLSMYLRSFGLEPREISMDDYFVDREKTPKDEKGEYDFEHLEALNLDLFDRQMKELLDGKEILMPTYNFLTGKPEFKSKLSLTDNSILLIEGIHGLNPSLLKSISKDNKYKIYISPLTVLNLDTHNRISVTDNRLLRRIVRDNRTRGHGVVSTLKAWRKVRLGEEKNIFPYQDEADVTFNTALIYELGILKTYVEPLLYSVPADSEYYEEARRLINMLKMFLPIPSEDIPLDSLLREFIGGSCFK